MRLRVCTIGSTEVLLHGAVIPLAAYMAICGQGVLLAAAMGSIILHEAAHAVAAAWLGARPDAVEITPLGAVMRLEDDARLTGGRRLLMLVAGPAMTLALCGLSLLLTARGVISVRMGRAVFRANVGLLAINLLPCLPLDGGRMLSLLLECVVHASAARRAMRWIGTVTGLACIALAAVVTWRTGSMQLTLAACGCVMLCAAHAYTESAAMAELRQWMARKIRLERRGSLPVRSIAVMESLPLRRLMTRLPQQRYAEVLVMENGSMRLLARRTEDEIIAAYMEAPGAACSALVGEAGHAKHS